MTFTGKFVLVFLSRTFSIHRTAEEGERYLFNSSLPLPPTAQTLRHQPDNYCRDLTSAHSQQPDSNQEPYIYLCNTYIHIIYIYMYIYIYIISITYTVEKKRKRSYNSQCHGNMEIHYYQKFHRFMPFFENFAPTSIQSQLRHWVHYQRRGKKYVFLQILFIRNTQQIQKRNFYIFSFKQFSEIILKV